MELKWKPVSEYEKAIDDALVVDNMNNVFFGYLFRTRDNGEQEWLYVCVKEDGNFEVNIKWFIPIDEIINSIPND